jgi:hypothetical protein
VLLSWSMIWFPSAFRNREQLRYPGVFFSIPRFARWTHLHLG